jgi:hypothetical protein
MRFTLSAFSLRKLAALFKRKDHQDHQEHERAHGRLFPRAPAVEAVPQYPPGIIAQLLQRTRANTVQPVLSVYTVTAATNSDVRARASIQLDLSEATIIPEIEPELILEDDNVVIRKTEYGHDEHIGNPNDRDTTSIDEDVQTATDLPSDHNQVVAVPDVQHETIEHNANTDPELEHELVECDTDLIIEDN